jgi:hypothetical protein
MAANIKIKKIVKYSKATVLKILKTKCTTLSDDLFLCQVSKGSAVRFQRNVPDKIDAEEKSGKNEKTQKRSQQVTRRTEIGET